MQPHPLFSLGSGIVPTGDHVLVNRIVQPNGKGAPIVFYRKTFKSLDCNIWSERENRFINLLYGHNLKHVVQLCKFEAVASGQFSSVETHDAGLTLDDWLQVIPRYADNTSLNHPFRRGEEFIRLMRACLLALQEIHELGMVHCDIKLNNICLPCTPPYQPDTLLKPDFTALRLIDFGFSLLKTQPLPQPLIIDPNHENSIYFSPLFRDALNADAKSGKPEQTNKLDYRVDLYSLGYMGEQIKAEDGFYWDTEERGVSGKTLIMQMIADLKAFGAGKTVSRYAQDMMLHKQMIARLDEWLKEAKPQRTFMPVSPGMEASGGRSHITPVTPLITPVEINTNGGIKPPPPPPPKKPWWQKKIPLIPLIPFFSLVALLALAGTGWSVLHHESEPAPVASDPAPVEVPALPPAPAPAPATVEEPPDPFISASVRLETALNPATAGNDVAFDAAIQELAPYVRHKHAAARALLNSITATWNTILNDDNASIEQRRNAYRRLMMIARNNAQAKKAIHQFDNAWQNHGGKQEDSAHWISWAKVMAMSGHQNEALALADALAAGGDIAQNSGQAYLLYSTIGANSEGARKDEMEVRKMKMIKVIMKSHDSVAAAVIIPDMSQGADQKISGYAYYLGLLNACALDTPDLPAARKAYTQAVADKNKNLSEAARQFLDSDGRSCPSFK